ncbi:MAG: hypothetical protein AB2A00_34525 [Myxococcota bacterium]
MSKDKTAPGMGTFKISDAVKRPVAPSAPAALSKKKGKEEPPPGVGFPTIEKLIESDSLDRSGLEARVAALEELAKTGNNKEKAGAKKALQAYQHAQELLEYLWNTKQKLASPPAANPADAKKKGARGGAAR